MIMELIALGGMSVASFQMFQYISFNRSSDKSLKKAIQTYKEG